MDNSEVSAEEPITRFARHSSQYSQVADRVYHSLFLPPNSLRLSVFRISDRSKAEVWHVGDTVVGRDRFTPLARADLLASDIRNANLGIEAEPTPHPRHADIVGWPAEKAERIDAAKTLATRAKLVLRDGS